MTEFLIKKLIKNYENTDNASVRSSYGKLSGVVGILCNIILFAAKIVIGIISSSVAIMADAINNFTDAASSIISLLGFKLSEKPADAEHPYGHGRYEYLAALSVAVLIIVIGIELLKSSARKIFNPEVVIFSIPLACVLAISIIVKLWMMIFNKKISVKIKSQALLATSADSRNDVIATSAVLAATILSHLSGFDLDGWIGLGVSAFILISGFGLVKDTIDPMLGSAPDAKFIEAIRDKILSYPGVLGMHDLMVHDYGPCRKFASVHVEMAAEEDVISSHDVIDNIETDFFQNDGLHLIVHYDPILTKDSETRDIRRQIENVVKEINPLLSIHDLRIVPGTTHTNLIFDCVSPYEVEIPDKELKQIISEKVKLIKAEYNCVITIDKSFVTIAN